MRYEIQILIFDIRQGSQRENVFRRWILTGPETAKLLKQYKEE